MSLNPGTRFGPYEVLELAGSGGMGEVYKARDARLDRTVAIKVLPAHASANPDLKQRFEREAQAIGNLKHPNICVLHDIGRENGTDFIVMEYLQGETLADRIARERGRPGSSAASQTAVPKSETTTVGRALKLEEALNIAIQIADALDQAHQHGVIHRDLKPHNVMLVSSGSGSQSGGGHVKLLDFGLAKLTTPDDAIASANTEQRELTGPGVVLGTVRYMSPEQIEGRPVDARTDIFAFGAVLYEMLTGRKAFDGKTQSSLIAAIMNVDPTPLSALMPIAPRALDRLVTRCLAKDPDDRWQSAHDLLIQLRWIAGRGAKGHAPTASGSAVKREKWALAAMAASVLVIAGMGVPAYRYMRGPAEAEEFRFRVPAVGLSVGEFAISPDGQTIVMVARPGPDAPALWLRPVNAVTYRRLEGTDAATQPFWSADSTNIGFAAGGRLRRVAASGAPPREIGTLEGTFYGGTWSADGTILFGSTAGVRRISAEGGAAEIITKVETPETGHYWPHFLPDGQHFLYTAWSAETDKRAIVAGTLGSTEKTRLMSASSSAQYSQGHLLFRRDTTVLAQPFDAGGVRLSGAPVQITGEVAGNLSNGRGYFQAAQTGILVYFQGGGGAGSGRAQVTTNWQFGWHDRRGQLLRTAGDSGPLGDADVSPDEKMIAVTRQDPGATGADIWVIDIERDVPSRLTLDPGDDMNPIWAPDGKRIAFTTFRNGNADIFVKNANGVGPETPLIESQSDEFIEDWSKDGRYIVYKQTQGEFEDLYVAPIGADGKAGTPIPVVQGPFRKDEPQFSYDGKWLAYGSDESGRYEVYVTSFPELDQKIKVSNEGGSRPRWRQDSREIYYMRIASGVMAATFTPGPKIEAGIPHLVYTSNAPGGADPTRHLFDVSADGQRFFQRTQSSISGGNTGTVPTVPPNFVATNPLLAAGGQFTPPNPALPNANGLTVIRNWTATVRKAKP